jgi:hypothetical protein
VPINDAKKPHTGVVGVLVFPNVQIYGCPKWEDSHSVLCQRLAMG